MPDILYRCSQCGFTRADFVGVDDAPCPSCARLVWVQDASNGRTEMQWTGGRLERVDREVAVTVQRSLFQPEALPCPPPETLAMLLELAKDPVPWKGTAEYRKARERGVEKVRSELCVERMSR